MTDMTERNLNCDVCHYRVLLSVRFVCIINDRQRISQRSAAIRSKKHVRDLNRRPRSRSHEKRTGGRKSFTIARNRGPPYVFYESQNAIPRLNPPYGPTPVKSVTTPKYGPSVMRFQIQRYPTFPTTPSAPLRTDPFK